MEMDHSVFHISIGAPLYVYKTENMNIARSHDMYGKGTSVVFSAFPFAISCGLLRFGWCLFLWSVGIIRILMNSVSPFLVRCGVTAVSRGL